MQVWRLWKRINVTDWLLPHLLGNLFNVELSLKSKFRCLLTVLCNENLKIWNRWPGHASEEALRKLDNCQFHTQCKLKCTEFWRRHPTLENPRGISPRCHDPLIERHSGENTACSLIDEMSSKAFTKTLKTRSEVVAAAISRRKYYRTFFSKRDGMTYEDAEK